MPAPVTKKKGDSGKQRPIVDDEVELTRAESPSAGARRSARLDDDDESTVSAKSRARRALETKKTDEGTDTGVPVVAGPSQPARGTMSSKRTLLETPMAVLPPGTKDSASTLVGLDTVNSQQTLSAVSEVTPASTSDSSRTIAAINPVLDPSTDPSAPVLAAPTHTHEVLDQVAPRSAPRRTLMDEQTAPLVYVGIGAGAVLIVALVVWILLS